MNVAAAKASAPVILRNAAGEPPLGSAGAFFRDDQGEMFVHPAEAYRTPATRIGILELDNGRWLALPPSFHVERPQYDSREAALRAAIASLIRRARKYMRNKEGEGTHWTEGYAGRVIEWALSLKPEKALHQGTAAVAAAPSGHPGLAGDAADSEAGVTDDTRGEPAGAVIQNSDPVVAELLAAHRARKEYPGRPTMTTSRSNGRPMTFLEDKIVTAPLRGIEVARDDLHPWLKPHCKDLTVWALRLGCAAIFANPSACTRPRCSWNGAGSWSSIPAALAQRGAARRPPRLHQGSAAARHGRALHPHHGEMDDSIARACALPDQLREHPRRQARSERVRRLQRSMKPACCAATARKPFRNSCRCFPKVPFKLVATATPSPNRYKELIHYAGFLGVMDTGLALTRWFQRNSEKAGDLTLYPHKEDEFWMWVHSWAAFLQRPSELGYSDDGYELPPLKLTWHEVPADHSKAEPERDGQGVMFRNGRKLAAGMRRSRGATAWPRASPR
jgi:hypothetical protein